VGQGLSANKVTGQHASRRFSATSRYVAPGVEFARGACRDYSFPPHVHEGFTIGLVTAGAESLQYGAEFHSVRAGAVYALPPDHIHGGRSIERGGWRYLSLYVAPNSLEAMIGEAALSGLFNCARLMENTPLAQKLAHALLAIDAAEAQLENDSAIQEILTSLSASGGAGGKGDTGARRTDARRLSHLRDYIDAHYTDDISLLHLAQVAGWSRQHVITVFKAELGVTPYAYLIARRLAAARARIMGGAPISAAALESGFYDQSHLTRHFVRAYGQPPAAHARSALLN